MPFTDAPEAKRVPTGGITATLRETKTFRSVWIILTIAAQQLHFGGSLIGRRLTIRVGHGEDEGRLLVTPDPKGRFRVVKFLSTGAARIEVGAWPALPRGPRPKGAVTAEAVDGGVLLTLPAWARPDGEGGKLDATWRDPAPKQDAAPKPARTTPGVSSLAAAGRAKARGL